MAYTHEITGTALALFGRRENSLAMDLEPNDPMRAQRRARGELELPGLVFTSKCVDALDSTGLWDYLEKRVGIGTDASDVILRHFPGEIDFGPSSGP